MTVENNKANSFNNGFIGQDSEQVQHIFAQQAHQRNAEKEKQLDKALAKVERIDFREQLSKLRTGIFVAWLINFFILVLTFQAAAIVAMNDQFQENMKNFFMITAPLAIVIALIITFLVSHFSYKTIMLTASPKAQKVDNGPIYNLVEEMCVAAGIPQKDFPIVYVDPTKETNAYALSAPQGTLVIVTQGLIDILNREQLQAVIAHELGHLVSGDSKAMTKIIAMTSFVSFISGGFRYMFYGGNNNNNNNNPIAIVITVISIIFLIFAPFLSMVANAFMSRQRESQADAMAVRLTRNPTALASALLKIDESYAKTVLHKDKSGNNSHKSEKRKKAEKEAQKFSEGAGHLAFFSVKNGLRTHPPTNERVAALKAMGAEV